MRTQAPVRVHPLEFAGKSVKDKLQDIRKELKGADTVLELCSE